MQWTLLLRLPLLVDFSLLDSFRACGIARLSFFELINQFIQSDYFLLGTSFYHTKNTPHTFLFTECRILTLQMWCVLQFYASFIISKWDLSYHLNRPASRRYCSDQCPAPDIGCGCDCHYHHRSFPPQSKRWCWQWQKAPERPLCGAVSGVKSSSSALSTVVHERSRCRSFGDTPGMSCISYWYGSQFEAIFFFGRGAS